jgi:hypothetical protein
MTNNRDNTRAFVHKIGYYQSGIGLYISYEVPDALQLLIFERAESGLLETDAWQNHPKGVCAVPALTVTRYV